MLAAWRGLAPARKLFGVFRVLSAAAVAQRLYLLQARLV
jgi:hypothetical protein